MVKAVRVRETGGVDAMSFEAIELAAPGAGQVRVRHTAVGLNFIDIYQRTGAFPLPLPTGLGIEAAGVVEDVGPSIRHLKTGDRVGYGTGPIGAYSTDANLPANRLLKLPADLDDESAAAVMLKGMTAHMLLHRVAKVGPGMSVVVHAAAGGVGSILVPWAKALGATVLGTAGSEEKRAMAKALGCDEVFDYGSAELAAAVKARNGGKGVDVVYDGIGKDTFEASLDCLRPFGMFVGFGTASGPIVEVDLGILNRKGSVYATRPSVMHHVAADADLQAAGEAVFAAIKAGVIKSQIYQRFALADVGKAHAALEGSQTTGATILLPMP